MTYYRIDVSVPIQTCANDIRSKLYQRSNYPVVFNFKNTKGLTISQITWIQTNFPNVQIRIAGGYTDAKISRDQRSYLKEDNIYTFNEITKILNEIDRIEKGMQSNWTPEQKLFYFIGYLKNKIIYHPDFEKQPSKDIRSLTGLFSHKTVCAGYALILKELCDRNGIYCDYVSGFTKKDKDTGKLEGAHAWNLIHLNGKVIPIDLTWTAGRNHNGHFLNIQDIGNVNEFIKSHIPDPNEPIQDYEKNLHSLEGNYIRGVYSLVNKTMVYDTTKLNFTRSDGTRFTVSLVNQTIDQNRSIFTYVYNGVAKDGTYARPMIVKSTTNIFNIHQHVIMRKKSIVRRDELLGKTRTSGENEELKRLTEQINKTSYYNNFYKYIADILFSKENILAAVVRKDFFIGGVEAKKDEKDHIIGIKGVEVDPKLGSELKKKDTKLCKRSDGSSFVLEEMTPYKVPGRNPVFMYRMYENVTNEEGNIVVKKNTIMTDRDLISDNRISLYNDFLDRDRIDRKEREASGYLGYYSDEGIRTYDPYLKEYFSNTIYKVYSINDNAFRNHYADLTFDDMKRLAKTFKFEGTNIVNRKTGQLIRDKQLVIQARFANLWLHSANSKYTMNEEIPGFDYAFNEPSSTIFKYISSKIQDSINNYGYIDTVDILSHVNDDDENKYKYAEEIIIKLFATQWSCNIVNDLFRLQNPGAMKENVSVIPFGIGFEGQVNAVHMISNREKEKAQREKQIIDVEYENGKAVLRGR